MLLPLKINTNSLRKIPLLCTTKVPFYYPHKHIFIQEDGIAMGSPLDPFSVIFVSSFENKVFIPSINLIFI